MQIDSLKQYIILDSRSMHIRITTKMENGTWKFSELMSSHDKLSIDSIQLEIGLDEIYDGVKF